MGPGDRLVPLSGLLGGAAVILPTGRNNINEIANPVRLMYRIVKFLRGAGGDNDVHTDFTVKHPIDHHSAPTFVKLELIRIATPELPSVTPC